MDAPTGSGRRRAQLPGNRVQSALLAVGMLRHFQALAGRQVDDEHPDVVVDSERVARLARLADKMANSATDPVDAVPALLRGVAGRRRKDLHRAAAQIRSAGWVGEDRATFVADQLLLSAFDGRPVAPVTPDMNTWFARIAELRVGSMAEAFARLAALQPALVELEAQVRWRKAHTTGDGAASSSLRASLRAYVRQSLTPVVGPAAVAGDKVLRSHTAEEIAQRYLDRIVRS